MVPVFSTASAGKNEFSLTVYNNGQVTLASHGKIRNFEDVTCAILNLLWSAAFGCETCARAVDSLITFAEWEEA